MDMMGAVTGNGTAFWVTVWLVIFAACGSSERGESTSELSKSFEQAEPKPQKSKVTRHKTPVPGKRVIPCEQLFDAGKFSNILGESVAIKTQASKRFTASCSIRRVGTPPSKRQQEALLQNRRRLGVLPGEEICTVRVDCWYPPLPLERFEKKCLNDGHRRNKSLGVFACVRETQKGVHKNYSYRFIDPDTTCTLEVVSGPSMTEEERLQSCAQAAMQVLSEESIMPTQSP